MTVDALIPLALAVEPAHTDSAALARLRSIARHAVEQRTHGATYPAVLVDLLAVLTWREAVIRDAEGIDGRTLGLDDLVSIWSAWGAPVATA